MKSLMDSFVPFALLKVDLNPWHKVFNHLLYLAELPEALSQNDKSIYSNSYRRYEVSVFRWWCEVMICIRESDNWQV